MIDYDRLVQKSLRNVVRIVLEDAEKQGIPGLHEFVITFIPTYTGVLCPNYLKEQYKDEITIVLRGVDYSDLVVAEEYFKVTIYINERAERLVIPFDSLLSFGDPFAKFGLQFDTEDSFREEMAASSKPQKDNIISLDEFRKKKR